MLCGIMSVLQNIVMDLNNVMFFYVKLYAINTSSGIHQTPYDWHIYLHGQSQQHIPTFKSLWKPNSQYNHCDKRIHKSKNNNSWKHVGVDPTFLTLH